MSTRVEPNEIYRDEIRRWAHALATADIDQLEDALDDGSTLDHVALFVDGNMAKRDSLLLTLLPFLAGLIEEMPEWIANYATACPFAAQGTGVSDADACLAWLEKNQKMTREQRDYVACQRARHAVEAAGRMNRVGHIEFQELVRRAVRLADELESNADLEVHINPIHAWARFQTPALLGGLAEAPADVLFFAAGSDIGTAVLEPAARRAVRQLAESGPWTIDSWACLTEHADRDELIKLCRDLAQIGLVAFVNL